ncbi:hypothetical protein [Streptomyces sp. NPDC048650]|uniref:hypothetical protein n=1 Tax=unclassified Streptomyces TaxID=2593676 RepID=UPI00371C9F34
MGTQQPDAHGESAVGIRSRAEVVHAREALEGLPPGHSRQTRIAQGALAAYRWALGVEAASPITGARGGGSPALPLLTAEVDAAAVQLEGTARDTAARDYIQGVHTALAWICGHIDQRP